MTMTYHYRPAEGESARILIIFHGLGATAENLIPIASFATDYHRYCFQAPDRVMALFEDQPCPAWFTWEKAFCLSPNNCIEMAAIAAQVCAILKQQHHWDHTWEIHALGFSQGGVMAAQMSTMLPLRSLAFLSSFYDRDYVSDLNLKDTDLFVSYSRSDRIVPYTHTCDFLTMLGSDTGRQVSHHYPDMGHGIQAELINDYKVFLQAYKS